MNAPTRRFDLVIEVYPFNSYSVYSEDENLLNLLRQQPWVMNARCYGKQLRFSILPLYAEEEVIRWIAQQVPDQNRVDVRVYRR